MEIKHTPLPWRFFPIDNSEEYNVVGPNHVEDQSEYIAITLGGLNDRGQNAAFIVRAVNAHDSLVEALSRLLSWVDNRTDKQGDDLLFARAALKLAKKEE